MVRGARNGLVQIVAIIGLMVLGCGAARAQDVKTNYMPGTDFSKYHTYKWIPEGNRHPDEIVDQEIKQAIDQALASKGLTKTDAGNADMYVGYQASVNHEKQWNGYGEGGGWRFGRGMGTATSSTIPVGTLVLDMYDPAGKLLIWRGEATKTLNPSNDPEKNQERLNKAMNKLLKNFPPKAKK